MVIKNHNSDFQTTATSLPSKVGRNEEYMSDAVSSIFATYQKSLEKKKDNPQHVGGIWDCYEVTDLPKLYVRNCPRVPFRNETEVVTGIRLMSAFVGDVMDTSESFSSSTDVSAFQYLRNCKEEGASGCDSAAFEGTKKLSTRKNELIIPPTERSILPPTAKKKNSDDESIVERTKRCKTISSEEINLISPYSKHVPTNEIDKSQRLGEKISVPPSLVPNIMPKNPTVLNVKEEATSKEQDKFYLGILEESHLNSSTKLIGADKVKSGTKKMVESGKLYQEEINVLKRVSSILESFAKEPTKPLGNKVSFSKEVEHLQRICGILKDLEAFSHNFSTDNVEIDTENLKTQVSCVQAKVVSGEAVDFLLKKEIKCAESKSNGISLVEPSSNSKDVIKSSGSLKTSEQSSSVKKEQRQSCSDIASQKQWDGSPISSYAEKREVSDMVTDSKHSARIQSNEVSNPVLQNVTIRNKTLSSKVSGSPQAIKAISRESDLQEKIAISNSMDTTLPLQTTEPMDTLSPEAKDARSPNAKDTTLPSKGMDALSTFKPMAAPLSSKTMGEISQSEAISEPSSAMVVTSPSKAVVKTLPSGLEDSTLSLKCTEVEPKEALRKMPWNRRFKVPPRFAAAYLSNEVTSAFKTDPPSPENPKPPLKVNEVSLSWRGERSSPYGLNLPRRSYNEQYYDAELEPRPLPWRAAQQGSDARTPVRKTNENIPRRSEGVLSWRVRDEALVAGASYDGRQRERAKARSPPLRAETASKKASNVGRSTVEDWRSKPEKIAQISNTIEKSYNVNAKQEEKALLVGTATKPISDSSLARASEIFNEMVTLKVFGEEKNLVDELMVPKNVLVRITRKYPGMIPPVNAQRVVLEYNADAVAFFLRWCICSNTFNLRSWEIALEVFALAEKYQVQVLREECKSFFDNKSIKPKQVQDIIYLARKLKITQVLKTSLMFAEVQAVPESETPAPNKKSICSVSCTTSVEPSEFDIPLHYMEDMSLGGTKKCDIQNDIVFEGTSGTFCITGFQIKLESEKGDSEKTLTIYFDVYKDNDRVFGEERKKPLMEMMIINFKQKLVVKPKKSVKLNVVIEGLCLRQCYCLKREKVQKNFAAGSFNATFFSDKKNDRKKSLFYIEKVFYTYEA